MVPSQISHYRIVKKLGAGGMGEVFLAQDVRLDRMVAIKMLPAKSIGDEQARRRLFREAKAAATLDHPNICAIHEVGEEADCAFIVMQYIEGATLSRMIKERVFSPLEVVDIAIQASEALAEAHSQGIIHRDIKPQNVILTPRGRVKILDFGLAKIVHVEPAMHITETESRLTNSGEVVGTVGYMSPEQLKDVPIDSRSDLFSLGVMLYECATGRSAFVGTSKIEICLQVIQVDPRRPSQVNPEIPLELDDIIVKAIAKDADARYQSAGEMLVDLRRLQQTLKGSRLDTRPLTPAPGSLRGFVTRGLSGSIRRPRVVITAGLLLVPLVILGIWSALHLWRSSPHQPSPEAKGWYDRGTEAIRAATYYQASKALEHSIELDAKFALAHARLAETYVEIDNTDKAMEELLRALSLVPDRSTLSSVDATHLDAIAATVRREFAAAIEYYGKILGQASESEKAIAYDDLGRSYQKNENLDKATECYLEATKRDAQSPAGFLHLAILYSRGQDSKNAEDAFREAEKLYKAMSNDEGRAEVFYQRGALFAKTGKLSEARGQLESVLDILKNVPDNKYQLVKTQLQLSLVYRDEGDIARAKDFAGEAIRLAQTNNIKNIATNGLIDLGLALLKSGEFDEAGKCFRQALDLAQRDKTRSSEARAFLALGRLNQQQNNPDEAISQVEEALKFYKPGGYRKETSIALTVLGRAYAYKGDYEIAYKTFQEQLTLSEELDDQALVADSHMSMSTLLGVNQERYPEALSHLNEAYRIDQSRNANLSMGFDEMNRGRYLWRLGRYDEARAALYSAFGIANRPEANYKAVLAWVHLTNAEMALSKGHYDEAKKKGQLALEVSTSRFRDVTLQAKYTIGLAEALSGAPEPGRKLCEEAAAIAKKVNSPQPISSALLALAEVLLLGKDVQGALDRALEAQAIFERSGQRDSEWRALLIAAQASERAGNKSAAQEYALHADSLCAGLQKLWGQEAYEGYVRRSDIQTYRKQVAQVLTRSK